MKLVSLVTLALGLLPGSSAMTLFPRQGDTSPDLCPKLPPWQPSKRYDPAELLRLTQNYPDRLSSTGKYNASQPASLTPATKLVKANHYDRLVAINPNATGLFERKRVLNPRVYPWSTIGKVWVSSITGIKECTGTLVGARTMLTASKCIPWGNTTYTVIFVPAYDGDAIGTNNQRPFGTAYSNYCEDVKHGDDVYGLDFATCQLNTNIGDHSGYQGWQFYRDDATYLSLFWSSVGYPLDFQGGRVPVIQGTSLQLEDVDHEPFRGKDGLELEDYQFYDAPGWLGGPLFQVFMQDGHPAAHVVGVMSGNETDIGFNCYDGIFRQKATVHAGGEWLTTLSAESRALWG